MIAYSLMGKYGATQQNGFLDEEARKPFSICHTLFVFGREIRSHSVWEIIHWSLFNTLGVRARIRQLASQRAIQPSSRPVIQLAMLSMSFACAISSVLSLVHPTPPRLLTSHFIDVSDSSFAVQMPFT